MNVLHERGRAIMEWALGVFTFNISTSTWYDTLSSLTAMCRGDQEKRSMYWNKGSLKIGTSI